MPTTVAVPRDTWVDLGPVPIVVELVTDGAPVFLVDAKAAPTDLQAIGNAIAAGQTLFFGGEGRRVYARHALPRPASVRVGTLDEFMAAPPPLDISGIAGRTLLAGYPASYTLLSAASATGSKVSGIRGGDYVWRIEGFFGGATVALQVLGLDGVTWLAAKKPDGTDLTATAPGSIGVGIGQGAALRAAISGGTNPSINSNLSGLT